MSGFKDCFMGQNGFEELRRYIKQGGDFCKDLSAILQERSEVEQAYAKGLAKLSLKLLKASKEAAGSAGAGAVGHAWQRVATEMECHAEIHRSFAAALSEEVVKPLKHLVDSQHRIRKSVESSVDKTAKGLSEWRQAEAKSKKTSFVCARDNEKLQDQGAGAGAGAGTGSSLHLHLHHRLSDRLSDKDAAKLESKRRKAEEAVKKADVEYYTFCIRAERARLDWEAAVGRGGQCLQALEEERLVALKELAAMYLRHLRQMGPKMVQSSERLTEPLQQCDPAADIQAVVALRGAGQPLPEQLLPDFYAEHVTLAMNRERRRHALLKVLQLVKQDLERERRSKAGVEKLSRALQQTPNFGADDSQQNVTDKLQHMQAMLTYLEAARFKVQAALAELDGRPRPAHPLADHITVLRDRQGLQQSILKVPPWLRLRDDCDLAGPAGPAATDWAARDRGAADGNSVQPDSDFDEFSSQGSEKDYNGNGSLLISECGQRSPGPGSIPGSPGSSNSNSPSSPSLGACRALYQYAANLYDELNLNPGDIINIHDKQADGWWLGELNGTIGIFPATYVEEIK